MLVPPNRVDHPYVAPHGSADLARWGGGPKLLEDLN